MRIVTLSTAPFQDSKVLDDRCIFALFVANKLEGVTLEASALATERCRSGGRLGRESELFCPQPEFAWAQSKVTQAYDPSPSSVSMRALLDAWSPRQAVQLKLQSTRRTLYTVQHSERQIGGCCCLPLILLRRADQGSKQTSRHRPTETQKKRKKQPQKLMLVLHFLNPPFEQQHSATQHKAREVRDADQSDALHAAPAATANHLVTGSSSSCCTHTRKRLLSVTSAFEALDVTSFQYITSFLHTQSRVHPGAAAPPTDSPLGRAHLHLLQPVWLKPSRFKQPFLAIFPPAFDSSNRQFSRHIAASESLISVPS